MKNPTLEKIREAGVVGAGGAGFPTHVKFDAQVERVLVNGASCEPLLMSDPHLMEAEPDILLTGLAAVVEATGASRGTVCLKEKHPAAVRALDGALARRGDPRLDLFLLEDFYPAGDEHVLVREVTGRIVPQAGIPLQVGLAVSNTETLHNVALALTGRPVTHRYLTVAGEVARPLVLRAPVGMNAREIIAAAGGPVISDFRVVDGGPMMGRVLDTPDTPITKTTSGLLVLPAGHNVVTGKTVDRRAMLRVSRNACCQCTLCTELCPRYLLGHDLHPHKLLRQLDRLGEVGLEVKKEALLCSECGICEKFACPMMISPREVNIMLKRELAAQGVRWDAPRKAMNASAFRDYRKVPSARLMECLGVARYAGHPPFLGEELRPSRVRLLLRQHIGAPAAPVVEVGQEVRTGDLVAEIPQGALGARVHASIDGRVESIDQAVVTLVAR